jgi:AAA family ATP:ADP antiporter
LSTDLATARRRRWITWLFRPFGKVEPGEAASVAVLTLTVFLILTAYYLLKTAREPLILLHGGAEVKSYASAGQAMLLVIVARVYSDIAKRVGRLKLITIVYLFFIANLAIFAVLTRAGVAISVPFYLWVGIFNLTTIAQFWSFAADIYAPEQGKRLFAVLGIGSSAGAVAGSQLAGMVVKLKFGPAGLMVGAALILIVCLGLIAITERRLLAGRSSPRRGEKEAPLVAGKAFGILVRDRYLLLIGALTLLLNWVNSNGEYFLDRTLLASIGHLEGAEAERFVGAFKADYFWWFNIVGMLLQLFVVSRIVTRLGVRNALFFLPAVAFLGYGAMLVAPVLAIVRAGKIAENSLDYSIQNTSRQALFLVTSPVEKYVGKQVVDTVLVRLGDVLSAATVKVGVLFALPIQGLAGLNLVLVALWIMAVLAIGREHARRSSEPPNKLASEQAAA